MAEKVILHIGAMKSGTSYIQQRLLANPGPLAEQGVLFPGRNWRDQVLGVRDAVGFGGDRKPRNVRGAWRRLLKEIEQWPGTAVISMESLGPTRPALVAQIVESLSPARVEAVMTVRDLGRNVPAMWQEGVQNYRTGSWEEFLTQIREGDRQRSRIARTFWRHQDTTAIARRWARAVSPENFTLVTLPPAGSDPEILWRRFCSVIGVDPESCGPGKRSNESLGALSAVVLRELNVRLAERGLRRRDYFRLVKHRLAKNGLVHRKGQEPTIGFHARWVTRRSREMIAEFERLGIRVVGDLRELEPRRVPGVNPSRLRARPEVEAAVDALADAVTLWAEDLRSRRRKAPAAK